MLFERFSVLVPRNMSRYAHGLSCNNDCRKLAKIAIPQSFFNWPLRSNIPAVKIADAPTLPLLPQSNDSIASLPSPEECVSGTNPAKSTAIPPSTGTKRIRLIATKLDPIDSSLFSVKNEKEPPTLLTDEENEDEFGEFLLDAVQWL
jgi:hypothetical protein